MQQLRARLVSRRKTLLARDPGKELKDHSYKQAIMELDNTIALIDSILVAKS